MQNVPMLVLVCGAWFLSLQVYPLILHRNCKHGAGSPVSQGTGDRGPAEVPRLALEELVRSPRACEQVFLDVGSNIGNHVRFLFEPEQFPRAEYPKLFSQYLRPVASKHTCAVGFEANPAHWHWLDRLADAYTNKGWPTRFIHKAVSDRTGFVKFYGKGDVLHNEWGFSVKKFNESKLVPQLIPTVDLAGWMRAYIRPEQTVVMKMDIEGSEYAVLSHVLLQAGRVLCASVRLLTLEYHPYAAPDAFRKHSERFPEFVRLLLGSSPESCGTVAQETDDESYWDNDVPLP